jgi:hypothetical protein
MQVISRQSDFREPDTEEEWRQADNNKGVSDTKEERGKTTGGLYQIVRPVMATSFHARRLKDNATIPNRTSDNVPGSGICLGRMTMEKRKRSDSVRLHSLLQKWCRTSGKWSKLGS